MMQVIADFTKIFCKLGEEIESFPRGSSNVPCKQLEPEVNFPEQLILPTDENTLSLQKFILFLFLIHQQNSQILLNWTGVLQPLCYQYLLIFNLLKIFLLLSPSYIW